MYPRNDSYTINYVLVMEIVRNQIINKGSMYHIVNKLTTFSIHIQHINILWIKYSEFLPDPLQNGSYCFFKHQTPMGLRVFRCCCFFFQL